MTKKRGRGEGTIYQRKDRRWTAAISTGDGRRKAFYGRTRTEVAEKLRRALQARADGLSLHDPTQGVGAFLATWLTDSAARKVRPRTLAGYEQTVRLHLTPRIGRVQLQRLTPQHLERLMNAELAEGRSPRSVGQDLAVLRTALNVAMRWGLIGRNVATLVEAPRVREREVSPLTTSDARRIMQAVRGDRLEPLIAIALGLGLRQSEALGLRWDDFDASVRTLSIRRALQRYGGAFHLDEPKTARSRRTIPLPDPLVRVLQEHRARQIAERLQAGPAWQGSGWGDLIFASPIGEPLHGTTITKQFRGLLTRAGMPPLRYHALRHGAASLMAAQGVPPRVAMEVLGHAQISTTMNLYSHVALDSQRDAVERIGQAVWGAS